MRHAARIKLDTETLAMILGYRDGTVLTVTTENLDLVVVIEHPSLPATRTGEQLTTVEPRGLGQ